MSVTTQALSAPACETRARALRRQPADGDKRNRADALFQVADFLEALRREGHLLQERRIDRPERDIIRRERQCAGELGLVMR